MSYVVPSVLVYQQLESAGGVANSTPDLQGCIIGPANNVISYVAGSTSSLIKTAATSAATANGSMTLGSAVVTFSVIPPFSVGDTLLVSGADASGGTLSGVVLTASGVNLTLDTKAGTTVTDAVVHKQGIIVNPAISNTFNLPSQAVGQLVNTPSIQVFVNQAKIETLSTGFATYSSSNALVYLPVATVGTTSAASAVVTAVGNVSNLTVGDTVTIVGAGVAGADLTSKILTIGSGTFTLSVAASTAVTGAAVTKAAISNVNQSTSTLMVEAGDEVSLTYTDNASATHTTTSNIVSVVSATGIITNITVADMLPTNLSPATTLSASASPAATSISVVAGTGYAIGDTIKVAGAGAGGTDLETVIGGVSGSTLSGLSPAIVTAVASGTVVTKRTKVVLKTRKLFNNQLVPITKPITGGANYVTTNTAVDGTITLNPFVEIVYGTVQSANVHIGYTALRTDLSGSVLSIANPDDNLGVFGTISDQNPLALGVSIALANTTTEMRAIAIKSNDAQGYASALELAEGERLYALAPLTQDESILQSFSLHAQAMSTPEEAAWRVALGNTAIPTTVPVGAWTADIVNSNGGNNTISVSAGKFVLTSSNSTFISDNVTPGDTLHITAGTGSPNPVGSIEVLQVVSNQQLVVDALGIASGVNFYITRTLTKTQRAASVAATSKVFGSNRFVHVQPDVVVVNINGSKVVLPGYYLCCALAGLIAGMPSQQGFTNIGIAGISDLSNSNFVFTRAQLNAMAEAGTYLFIQDTSGGLPYTRHELTTDMSVYYYRELQAVKNWDFLSYFYYDKLKLFIGKWNITSDTISIIRQTIDAGSSLLKSKKLPKIGAPLIDAKITLLAQDKNNVDQLNCNLAIQMPTVLNYLNLYLIV